jgi:hypothetical protein
MRAMKTNGHRTLRLCGEPRPRARSRAADLAGEIESIFCRLANRVDGPPVRQIDRLVEAAGPVRHVVRRLWQSIFPLLESLLEQLLG